MLESQDPQILRILEASPVFSGRDAARPCHVNSTLKNYPRKNHLQRVI